MHAPTPAVSILGNIPPGILRKILRANQHFFDAGLAARMLFVMPPDRPQYWTDDVVSVAAKNSYQEIFDNIFAWRFGEKAIDPENPKIVRLSKEAEELFIDFYNVNADERAAMESGIQKSFWPKLTGYAARIALILHIVRWIGDETSKFYMVDADTMEAAIQITQWFKHESLRIVEAMCGEPAQLETATKEVLRALQRSGGAITLRDLARGPRLFRGPEGQDRAERTLREMVENGKLQVRTDTPEHGPSVEVFYL